jgi:hypothetical protein
MLQAVPGVDAKFFPPEISSEGGVGSMRQDECAEQACRHDRHRG